MLLFLVTWYEGPDIYTLFVVQNLNYIFLLLDSIISCPKRKAMPIYYTMSIDSRHILDRGLSSQRCSRNFRRGNERFQRKSENDEAKRKRRARDQRFTSPFLASRNIRAEIILGFDLLVAQLPLVPRHHEEDSFFARFSLGCTYFMSVRACTRVCQ